jgi:hypothetical protein
MEKKRTQIKHLGFEAGRYQATTTFKVDGYGGLVDGLLGLRSLEVTAGQAFETRFGIKLSLKEPHFAGGTLHIQPEKADSCIVSVREGSLTKPAVFSADIIAPPIKTLPKEHVKFLIKAPLFRLLIDGKRIQFSTNEEEINAARLKIDDWLHFCRMIVALCDGAEMTVKPRRLAEVSFPLKLADVTLRHEFESLQRAFEGAERLLKLAGAPEPVVSIEGIAAIGPDLIKLDNFFSGAADVSPIGFAVDWPPEAPVPAKLDFLYVNYLKIADVTLAHYSVAEMLPQTGEGRIVWKSGTMSPREITFIQNFPNDYERFVERAKHKENVAQSMIAEPRSDS